MIIKTKRPASIFILDSTITALAWIAFIYQFTKGVVFLLSEHSGTPLSNVFGLALSPTTTTLMVCIIVCLFNAAIVYLWARWHKAQSGKPSRHLDAVELSPDSLANHFSLSPRQLDNVQDSRVTVVYHSAAGGITHLETSDLQLQQVSSSIPDAQLRVA